jgi:hypothetical protein
MFCKTHEAVCMTGIPGRYTLLKLPCIRCLSNARNSANELSHVNFYHTQDDFSLVRTCRQSIQLKIVNQWGKDCEAVELEISSCQEALDTGLISSGSSSS